MHESPAIIQLLTDDLSVILSYVFSTPQMNTVLDQQLDGEWPPLSCELNQIAERKADRALLELATHLRILDDREAINAHHKKVESVPLGFIEKSDGSNEELFLRDATNKIIHADHFDWDMSDPSVPIVKALGTDPSRWVSAEILIIALTAYIMTLPNIMDMRDMNAT